jgi:hypothetical protein
MSIAAIARQKTPLSISQLGNIVLVNLIILVMLIIPIELFFGNWFGTKTLFGNWFGTTIQGGVCNIDRMFDAAAIYGYDIRTHYVRDAQCLRGPYDPSSVDVITVGGSTTDQKFITEGSTWQDHVALLFNRHGRKLSIANAGIDGQSTIGNLWDFKYWFPNLVAQPKFYLFYIGVNDIYRLNPREGDEDSSISPPTLSRKFIRFVKQQLDKSALFSLYQTINGNIAARKLGVTHRLVDFDKLNYTDIGLIDNYSFYDVYLHDVFKPRLSELLRATRALGAEPIFVTQRSHFWQEVNGRVYGVSEPFDLEDKQVKINGYDWYVMEKAQIKAIQDFCKENHLSCIDGHKAVESNDFYDFVHTTPQGAEKLGLYIGERLLNLINQQSIALD